MVNSNNLLIKSNGDNALVGANDDARRSRAGTLKARNDGALGGTLIARDGARDQSKRTQFEVWEEKIEKLTKFSSTNFPRFLISFFVCSFGTE